LPLFSASALAVQNIYICLRFNSSKQIAAMARGDGESC
jgi:hypothetical protein